MRTATSATERLFNFVADVLSAYDFSTAARILDVGGGAGALLIEMSYAHPALTGCVLDLPRCEVAAWHALLEANLTDGPPSFPAMSSRILRAASTRCISRTCFTIGTTRTAPCCSPIVAGRWGELARLSSSNACLNPPRIWLTATPPRR